MRLALTILALCVACGDHGIDDPREAEIVNVMASADESVIRTRPLLSAGKYLTMASGPYAFFRGTVPVYRADVRNGGLDFGASRFALDSLVPSLGDPHPENFGILYATDGTPALEPNDFDAADRLPYLWDVRRLAAGMGLSALVSNNEPAQEAIVRAAMLAYRDGIEAAAKGQPPGRVTEGGAIVADLLKRSARDRGTGKQLDEDTVLSGGNAGKTRKFKLGILDPTDPQSVFEPLPPAAMAALPAALEAYRRTLIIPPAPENLTVIDAVRELGSGVSSWARVRVLVLVRGATDDPGDDVMLEMKEIADSGIGGLAPPTVYADSLGARVVLSARAAWGRLDAEPLWGWTTWLGLPCQIRLETEGQKGVSVDRFVDDEGTPEALADLGTALGTIVARVHASEAAAIAAKIAIDRDGWVAEQTESGRVYAALVMQDHQRFVRSLHRTDGLRLGIPFDPADAPSPDMAAVFGVPPPLPALP